MATIQLLGALLLCGCCLVRGKPQYRPDPESAEGAGPPPPLYGAYFRPRDPDQSSGRLTSSGSAPDPSGSQPAGPGSTPGSEQSPSAAQTQPQSPAFSQGFSFGQGFPQGAGYNLGFQGQPFAFGFGQGAFQPSGSLGGTAHLGSGFGSQGFAQNGVSTLGQSGAGIASSDSGLGQAGFQHTGGSLDQGGNTIGQHQQFSSGNVGQFNGFGQSFGPHVSSRFAELNGAGTGQDGSSAPLSSGSVVGFYGGAPNIGFGQGGTGGLGHLGPQFGFNGNFQPGGFSPIGGVQASPAAQGAGASTGIDKPGITQV